MNTLFYLFASLMLTSGVMVIQSRNPVYSVLFLILVFFHGAALLLLLGLDFFAMTFLVVYVGAIAVLFLFVVMMLNINVAELQERRLRYLPMGGVLGLLFVLEGLVILDVDLVPLLYSSVDMTDLAWTDWTTTLGEVTNMHTIGRSTYILIMVLYFPSCEFNFTCGYGRCYCINSKSPSWGSSSNCVSSEYSRFCSHNS